MRYKTLGRSGLNVSELCLGTMTFGEDWGWGLRGKSAGRCSMRSRKPAGISSIPLVITPTEQAKNSSETYAMLAIESLQGVIAGKKVYVRHDPQNRAVCALMRGADS